MSQGFGFGPAQGLQATGLAPSVQLDEVLANGRETGGNDIVLTAGDEITAPTATADSDGGDVKLTATAGGAHTSNDPAGGDIVLTPGAKGSGGSGADGKVLINLPTIGEVSIEDASGELIIDAPVSTNITFSRGGSNFLTLNNAGYIYFNNYFLPAGVGALDFGNTFNYLAKVRQERAEFVEQGAAPGAITGSAQIYSKDVSGTTEAFVMDEAGNETQLSCHRMDGPAWLYDEDDPFPRVLYDANYYLGVVRYTNESRKAALLELMLADPAALAALPADAKKLTHTETFAEHNARLELAGEKALTVRDWDADQEAIKQRLAEDEPTRQAQPEGKRKPHKKKGKPAWMKARRAR